MRSVEEHLEIVLANVLPLESLEVGLLGSVGCVLAEKVTTADDETEHVLLPQGTSIGARHIALLAAATRLAPVRRIRTNTLHPPELSLCCLHGLLPALQGQGVDAAVAVHLLLQVLQLVLVQPDPGLLHAPSASLTGQVGTRVHVASRSSCQAPCRVRAAKYSLIPTV